MTGEMAMTYILSIESGTSTCSVGISNCGETIAQRVSNEGRDHARLVAQFADEVICECGIEAKQLAAVAVSMGPGSYTGLRIGVSFAKGLCYGLNIPLIGVGSLEALARVAKATLPQENTLSLRPMIDARRMEVYTQLLSSECEALSEIEAKVVESDTFACEEVVIFGDGAAKCVELMPSAKLIDVMPSSAAVGKIAYEKLLRGETEDVAYFEPFYLKEVVVTKSKKNFFNR